VLKPQGPSFVVLGADLEVSLRQACVRPAPADSGARPPAWRALHRGCGHEARELVDLDEAVGTARRPPPQPQGDGPRTSTGVAELPADLQMEARLRACRSTLRRRRWLGQWIQVAFVAAIAVAVAGVWAAWPG